MMSSGRWMGLWQVACCNRVAGRQAWMFSLKGLGPFLFLGVAMVMLLLLRHLWRFLWLGALSFHSEHNFNMWSLGFCEAENTGSGGYGCCMIVLEWCFGSSRVSGFLPYFFVPCVAPISVFSLLWAASTQLCNSNLL